MKTSQLLRTFARSRTLCLRWHTFSLLIAV
jgi:hypothetical protein